MSPGSAFWLPHGTRIYNTLVEFMRVSSDVDLFCFLGDLSSRADLSSCLSERVPQAQLPRGHFAQHVQLEAVGDVGSLGQLRR